MLTSSLFKLPCIISEKYMLRFKMGARYVPTSTLSTGLQVRQQLRTWFCSVPEDVDAVHR